jgi:hypothetical protein
MDGGQCRCHLLAASEWTPEGTAMNTTMLVLAVLFFVIAVFAACRRDAPTAAAAPSVPCCLPSLPSSPAVEMNTATADDLIFRQS